MSTSPTARTLEACRKLGRLAGVVERYCQYTRRRHDLFGFADIVAVEECGSVFIQCTSAANMASRVRKIIDDCQADAHRVLTAGNTIEVWGWRKYGRRWDARRVRIRADCGAVVSAEMPTANEDIRAKREKAA